MTYAVMKQKMRTQMRNATRLGGICICRYVSVRRLGVALQPTFSLRGFMQL
jgi:hypothetical protein